MASECVRLWEKSELTPDGSTTKIPDGDLDVQEHTPATGKVKGKHKATSKALDGECYELAGGGHTVKLRRLYDSTRKITYTGVAVVVTGNKRRIQGGRFRIHPPLSTPLSASKKTGATAAKKKGPGASKKGGGQGGGGGGGDGSTGTWVATSSG